jgi:hypothetical protein
VLPLLLLFCPSSSSSGLPLPPTPPPPSTLCDPYLNLFRGIIPPLGGTLDFSPILAFVVLSVSGAWVCVGRGGGRGGGGVGVGGRGAGGDEGGLCLSGGQGSPCTSHILGGDAPSQ